MKNAVGASLFTLLAMTILWSQTSSATSATNTSSSINSAGGSSSATLYKGTITLKANARQDGTPSLIVSINSIAVGTEAITADDHFGQVGTYVINYSLATVPQSIDIKLDGYSSTENEYISANLFNLEYSPSGGKSIDLVKTAGQVISGKADFITGVRFYTNGSDVRFATTAEVTDVKGWAPPANSLGINVSPIANIYQSIPFVDAFKESSPWSIVSQWVRPGTPITGTSVIGSDGWVKSLATNQEAVACMFTGAEGHYPAGVYTLMYEGTGAIQITGEKNVTNIQILSSSSGLIKAQITPSVGNSQDYGVCIRETSVNPSDPIKNIRFILPGYETTYLTEPFNPAFLNELKPFNIIRFIGWDNPDRSPEVNWSDRRPPTYPTQAWNTSLAITTAGVSIEYQVALANTLNANPWFTIPSQASNDYVLQMATYVHQNLNPNLHPMLEYSNEIWNGVFPAYQYMITQGTALNLDPGTTPQTTNAGLYYYGLRAGQIFDIWNNVYGSEASKISHIIAGKEDWATEADRVLGFNNAYKKADVLAVGAYASPFNLYQIETEPTATAMAQLTTISKMSISQIQQAIESNITTVGGWLKSNKAIAEKYDLTLAVYEGGIDTNVTGLTGPLAPIQAAMASTYVAATSDPHIGTVYTQLLNQAAASGVTSFNYFDDVELPGKYGSFGALDYQDESLWSAPRWVALKNYASSHPVRE